MNDFFAFCRLYKWRIISVCFGILFTILIFTIGFWRTLLLFAIVGIFLRGCFNGKITAEMPIPMEGRKRI